MQTTSEQPVDRREALRSWTRWLALAGIGVGVLLLGRTRVSAGCVKVTPCSACGELSRCGLPRALAIRESSGNQMIR
jgi:hypothetical protein